MIDKFLTLFYMSCRLLVYESITQCLTLMDADVVFGVAYLLDYITWCYMWTVDAYGCVLFMLMFGHC